MHKIVLNHLDVVKPNLSKGARLWLDALIAVGF